MVVKLRIFSFLLMKDYVCPTQPLLPLGVPKRFFQAVRVYLLRLVCFSLRISKTSEVSMITSVPI